MPTVKNFSQCNIRFVGDKELEVYDRICEIAGPRGLKPLVLQLFEAYLKHHDKNKRLDKP